MRGFNVNEFISKTKSSGVMRNNKFLVEIPLPASLLNSKNASAIQSLNATNKNLELFEFIYKFQGIDNLKKLTFKQLQEYICYLRYSPKNGIDKKHTKEEIFSSLTYLFKK